MFLDGPNPQLMYAVNVPAEGEQSSTLNGSSFDNCRQITDNFNFHWAVRDGMFKAAHEGIVPDNFYLAFAVVADQTAPNRMAGADTIVTYFNVDTNEASAVDYIMNAVQECDFRSALGVCPDTIVDANNTNADLVFNVTGFHQDGIHVVSYVRPLASMDLGDLNITDSVPMEFLFAQGPMNAAAYPAYHMANRGSVELQLNRPSSFQCTQLMPQTVDNPAGGDNSSAATLKSALVFAILGLVANIL